MNTKRRQSRWSRFKKARSTLARFYKAHGIRSKFRRLSDSGFR